MFALLNKKVKEPIFDQDESIPSEAKFMLHDFQDLVPNELPKELLPMQDI